MFQEDYRLGYFEVRQPGVLESAVVGVPHADFGEAVVAIVVPESGARPRETEIIAATKSQLANFKIPKAVIFLEQLPRNTMGKVQKAALRSQYRDVLSE